MLHHRCLRLGRKPDPATRAADVADKAVCDGPPSQFFEEWLRVYRKALREFSSDLSSEEQADDLHSTENT